MQVSRHMAGPPNRAVLPQRERKRVRGRQEGGKKERRDRGSREKIPEGI